MRKSLLAGLSLFTFFIFASLSIAIFPAYLLHGRDIFVLMVPDSTVFNTMLANSLAYLVGAFCMYRFERYTQRKPIAFILPITLSVYAVLMGIFLGLRVPYSIKMIIIAALILPLLLGLQHLIGSRGRKLNFLTLPFGEALDLKSSQYYVFTILSKPMKVPTGVHGLVVDFNSPLFTPKWEAYVSDCAVAGLHVFSATQLKESISGRVNIAHLMANNFGVLAPSAVTMIFKRLIDLLIVLASLPIVIPLCFMTALFISFDSKGGPFFWQRRVGFRGEIFTIIKFRSMYVSKSNQASTQKKSESDRITPVGRVIRKYRIDELPQLWNVLKGDLSLIGPRPETDELSKKYKREIPFYSYRSIIKPGLTGWAQVMQGHVHGTEDTKLKLEYDFYYLRHFSLWLDLLIFYKTIKTLITGFGSR